MNLWKKPNKKIPRLHFCAADCSIVILKLIVSDINVRFCSSFSKLIYLLLMNCAESLQQDAHLTQCHPTKNTQKNVLIIYLHLLLCNVYLSMRRWIVLKVAYCAHHVFIDHLSTDVSFMNYYLRSHFFHKCNQRHLIFFLSLNVVQKCRDINP